MTQNSILIQQISQKTLILALSYREQSEILFVGAKQGFITVYDTSNKSQFYQIGQITLNSELINCLQISQDGLYLYVAADSTGLLVYQFNVTSKVNQLNDNSNQRSFSFYQVAFAQFNSELMQIQVTSTYYIFGFGKYEGFFFSNAQQIYQASQNDFPLQIIFQDYWPFSQMVPVIQCMLINQQENLLLLGVRSQGLYVFDISQNDEIKLLQQINFNFSINSMQFSKDEQYLYISSGQSIIRIAQIEMNLNNDFPNLFNFHQIKFDQFTGYYKWRCYTDPSDTYLIGAFDVQGIYVFPYYQNPYRLNISDFQNFPIPLDSLEIDPLDKYLIIPQYDSGEKLLSIYQYKPLNSSTQQEDISPTNIVQVKQYMANQTKISEMITFSLDRTFAVQTYEIGLILYNSTDIFNMYVYTLWQYPDFMVGDNQGACITNDNKWVLSTIRFVAIYLLNVENKTNPVLANYLINLGGEAVFISQLYDYAYLIDGTKGFAIIDTKQFPSINIISRVTLQGYTVMILLLQNEDYVLITQLEKGLLSLIDIRDKYFPQVITSITYESQNAQALCSNQSKDYLFIGVTSGMITMPLKSNILIHTDVYLITQNSALGNIQVDKLTKKNQIGDSNNPSLTNEYIFQVGQVIKFDFVILYSQAYNMHVNNVYLYQQGQIQNLPQYIIFDQPSQSIQITVNQEMLGNSQNNINLSIIILWVVIPLNPNSFIYSSEGENDIAVTNSSQSTQIFQYLMDQNILDSVGIINSQYDFTKDAKLNIQFQNQIFEPSSMSSIIYKNLIAQLTLKINLTLKKSCYANPIKFYVKSSLQFDNSNSNQFISSVGQENISVTLQINSQDGKLVEVSQSSVITYMQANQDQLKIQGTLIDVNNVLRQKIIFANSSLVTQNMSPNITITIEDNINFPLVQTYSIYESNFVILKKQLKVNQYNNLQQQIYQQFSDAILDINANIDISFSSNTFLVQDIQDLKYTVFLQNEHGLFEQIPSSFWLQQQDSKLNFKGSTTSKMYGQIYRFKIQASDGYTTSEDYFYITVKGIPFIFIFNQMLTILGPLAAAFGIYKKRFIVYNIIFKGYVTFSEEEVLCGQEYYKEIIILGNMQEIAQQIVNKLFKKISSSQKKNKLNNHIVEEIHQFQSENENERSINLHLQDYQNYRKYSETKQKFSKEKNEIKKLEQIFQNLNKLKAHEPKSIFEKRYLNNLGNIIYSKVIEDIVENRINPDKYLFQQNNAYQKQIKNPNTRLNRCIKALLSRYFLNLDKRTYNVYCYIRDYCILHYQLSQYDWSKSVVYIDYAKKQEDENHNKLNYPSLQLNYKKLIYILNSMKLLSQNEQFIPTEFTEFQKLIQSNNVKINPFILREVIFADTLGIQQFLPSKLNPSLGLSIHLNTYDISQVVAFKKKNLNKWFKGIQQLLNMEYEIYGVSENIKLPQWINLDQNHEKIFLKGIPQDYNEEEILIRIYDTNNYVVQQFLLKIKNNTQSESIDKQQENDQSSADKQFFSFQNQQTTLNNTNFNKSFTNSPLTTLNQSYDRVNTLTLFQTKLGKQKRKQKFISLAQSKDEYHFRSHLNTKNTYIVESHFNKNNQNITFIKDKNLS
ncbi:hypothetical protein ABPG74_009953 [Tetrahymena malaccensis]